MNGAPLCPAQFGERRFDQQEQSSQFTQIRLAIGSREAAYRDLVQAERLVDESGRRRPGNS